MNAGTPDGEAEPPVELPQQSRPRPALRSSERELRAFVSSVMRGVLDDARQEVVNALDGVPFLSSWAFEYTPASSEAADDTYLRHVRDADFVIWLASDGVTTPVVNEIREALAKNRRLLVIRFGTAPRSVECQGLISEIGLRAKYADAPAVTDLRSVLQLSIGDEVVRALRGEPDLGRLALIEALGRASRARCVRRWQAPGLPRDEALALADDPAIGAPPGDVLPTTDAPVVVIGSDMGSGKSLAAERHLQAAVADLRIDGAAPIPVWLTAAEITSGVRPAVVAHATGIGDPRIQGATVVVDGLDEVAVEIAQQALGQARELTTEWPATSVVITSRPTSVLTQVPEYRQIPELTDDEMLAVVAIGAGAPIAEGLMFSLAQPVQKAIRRPLFALLYGLTRRDDAPVTPHSKGDLLAFLGAEARRRGGQEYDEALRRLAVASVRRDLGAVPGPEVDETVQLEPLVDSGLVNRRSDGYTLGLPVIAQWFAAQALTHGEVSIDEICADPADIDLWRYPLAIAVATSSHDTSMRLLGPIMRANPGFAFRVVDEALGNATLDGFEAPPWRQAGAQMRDAMQALASGLGPLGTLTLPVDASGALLPLGCDSRGQHVDYAFYIGDAKREPVYRLPAEWSPFDPDPDSAIVGFSAVGRGSAWAWRWARDRFRHQLAAAFKARDLPFGANSPIKDEGLWMTASLLSDNSSFLSRPVDLAPVVEGLDDLMREVGENADVLVRGIPVPAKASRDLLVNVMGNGVTHLSSPHPGPDLDPSEGGRTTDFYSDERLVERVTSIYEHAIQAYQDLVEKSFAALSGRLALYSTFPARYIGYLNPGDDESLGYVGIPALSGYFEPLPPGEVSAVEISISRERFDYMADYGLSDRLRAMRPDAARWITGWVGGGALHDHTYTPSTAVAYAWLWRDLSYTKVADGLQPSWHAGL
jgi:RNA-binding protein YhbY